MTVAAGETSARLRGLRSQLVYHAAVRAYNSAGAGPFSATVNATTEKTRTYLLCWGQEFASGATALCACEWTGHVRQPHFTPGAQTT